MQAGTTRLSTTTTWTWTLLTCTAATSWMKCTTLTMISFNGSACLLGRALVQ